MAPTSVGSRSSPGARADAAGSLSAASLGAKKRSNGKWLESIKAELDEIRILTEDPKKKQDAKTGGKTAARGVSRSLSQDKRSRLQPEPEPRSKGSARADSREHGGARPDSPMARAGARADSPKPRSRLPAPLTMIGSVAPTVSQEGEATSTAITPFTMTQPVVRGHANTPVVRGHTTVEVVEDDSR